MSVVILLSAVVGVFLALLAGCGLTLLARWAPSATQPRLGPTSAPWAALVLSPAIVALLGFIAILVPGPLLNCHCGLHGLHQPHLCIYHPELAEPLLGPALGLGALWLAATLFRLSRVVRDIAWGERRAALLRRLPALTFDGIDVRLAENVRGGAFTIGLQQPIIVVDRALWKGLSKRERGAVVYHESAHIKRRDALTLSVLRLASALAVWPPAERWMRAWRTASEAACDRHAALTLGDPSVVARALVRVERLRSGLVAEPSLGVAAGTDLEARVHALLAMDEAAPSPPLASDLVAIALALVGVSTLVVASPGGLLHHLVESLVGLVRP